MEASATRLTWVRRVTESGTKNHRSIYRCSCGRETVVLECHVKCGHTRSCGCLERESRFTHRMTGSGAWKSWRAMLNRCRNPNQRAFRNYGGRGIKVCKRWASFENFFADMGPRPEGHRLERKDNDGDYTPTNCRWATNREQCNNMRKNVVLEHDGKRLTATQWSKILPISEFTIRARKHRGLTDEQCLTMPVKPTGPRRGRC